MNLILALTIAAVGQTDSASMPEFTLEELVQGNQQALGLVHELELVMRHTRQNYMSGEHYGEPTEFVWKWAKKGDLERLRYSDGLTPTDDGRPRDLYDWFIDGSEKRLLRNWDPENPQSITPINQGTVRATIYRNDGKAPIFDATRFLLWTFSTNASDERRTLQEFVAESPRAKLLGRTEIDGHAVWHIRADHPGLHGQEMKGFYFDFFVDPSLNFAVRRVIEHKPGFQMEINGVEETYNIDIPRTVKEFKSVGGGVYVPLEIESKTVAHTSDQRRVITRTEVEDLVVNEPLSRDAFAFRFPENTLVAYYPPVSPDKQRVVLWGPENRPAKEIEGPGDVPGVKEATEALKAGQFPGTAAPSQAPLNSESRSLSLLLWLNVAGILAIVAAFMLQRRRQRKGA